MGARRRDPLAPDRPPGGGTRRDGGYDYYLFDATWLITGEHGHTVNIPIPNGFNGMLPAAVVRRLIGEYPYLALQAPPPSDE